MLIWDTFLFRLYLQSDFLFDHSAYRDDFFSRRHETLTSQFERKKKNFHYVLNSTTDRVISLLE